MRMPPSIHEIAKSCNFYVLLLVIVLLLSNRS